MPMAKKVHSMSFSEIYDRNSCIMHDLYNYESLSLYSPPSPLPLIAFVTSLFEHLLLECRNRFTKLLELGYPDITRLCVAIVKRVAQEFE